MASTTGRIRRSTQQQSDRAYTDAKQTLTDNVAAPAPDATDTLSKSSEPLSSTTTSAAPAHSARSSARAPRDRSRGAVKEAATTKPAAARTKKRRRKSPPPAVGKSGRVRRFNAAGDELYCHCQQIYDGKRFMVGCDSCDGWFHPACLGITEEIAQSYQHFICQDCASSNKALINTQSKQSNGAAVNGADHHKRSTSAADDDHDTPSHSNKQKSAAHASNSASSGDGLVHLHPVTQKPLTAAGMAAVAGWKRRREKERQRQEQQQQQGQSPRNRPNSPSSAQTAQTTAAATTTYNDHPTHTSGSRRSYHSRSHINNASRAPVMLTVSYDYAYDQEVLSGHVGTPCEWFGDSWDSESDSDGIYDSDEINDEDENFVTPNVPPPQPLSPGLVHQVRRRSSDASHTSSSTSSSSLLATATTTMSNTTSLQHVTLLNDDGSDVEDLSLIDLPSSSTDPDTLDHILLHHYERTKCQVECALLDLERLRRIYLSGLDVCARQTIVKTMESVQMESDKSSLLEQVGHVGIGAVSWTDDDTPALSNVSTTRCSSLFC